MIRLENVLKISRGVLWEKVFLKISQNSRENTCARDSSLIKLQPLQAWGLQLYKKRDSGLGVFLWILWNFQEHFFYRTPLDDCFWSYTTWRNCINTSYILAIKVVRFWSKDTALEWHNREAVSFFLNKFSTVTHLWYKIIPCTYE